MKFQNSSIHGFKVMLCIKKRDERTEGRTNNPEAICPSNFFEVGDIKSTHNIPLLIQRACLRNLILALSCHNICIY